MHGILVDEDLPRSLAPRLLFSGIQAFDVRDVGLRGAVDADVFRYAVSQHLPLVTGDVEFGNILTFPLRSHFGVVLSRFPNDTPAPVLVEALAASLAELSQEDLTATLVVLQPGRIRVRRGRE